MADVFLSYAREDAARAQRIAEALLAEGVDVFWDNEIPPGSTWADFIESKLTQCKALVVLWSEHSTKSQWVREEARMGRDKGVLIPVMIDASTPPFGFGELQAANLSDWQGQRDQPNWRRFADAVSNAAKGAPRQPAQTFAAAPPRDAAPQLQPQQPQAPANKGLPVWAWVAGAVIATIVVLGLIGSLMPKETGQTQQAAYAPPQQQMEAAQPQQGAPAPPQSAQILMQQLQQAGQLAAQQGFQQVGQPFAGGLIQGQSWNVPAQLVAGYEYRVLGVCDQNCRDLDLSVYDESGATVAQDNATDDHPTVAIAPAANGQFTIQAQMFQCSAQPCYYALVLYGRARQY
ncbi:MAG: toll/interleukin-1 receptor domain-containing protein [Proteobacteria bacterium]|nr:toll/interleukin-1 receptor domain-containing protein [Pseudomonadota bacterium]